ncbi:MAG: Glucosyl-3-phosphoglycerate synthase [uncultured Solirubrobacteraceae bacterium]|uniref:Glucosyl-3-phosphoglycerate synthase n=1 Tax=uncultured Solirubrobacteraceae bacterium TaxID=1162706 RepID=A0A6J4SQ44_9ACTN|nr:MAG: Glucosyl-3-phosphoglycerate synthase [uncultured Solirubrobacteraceae bacterium]
MRTHHHAEFTAGALADHRERTVSVCLPARNEAATIGAILEVLMSLRERRVVDQVVVVDDSTDGTGDIARRLGAEVFDQSGLVAERGRVNGKGDAMWRALSVLRGDIVLYLDADSEDFGEHFALGLLGPLLTDDRTRFVKGFYRRPWQQGGVTQPEGGGRVTELTARPLLNRFFPELARVRQPLAGEIAAHRDLLMRLPFCCGYGVDIALLIDAWRVAGIGAMAQVDLDARQNRHQPLADLGVMAAAVTSSVTSRLVADGRLSDRGSDAFLTAAGRTLDVDLPERPPMADYVASARRSRFTVASA